VTRPWKALVVLLAVQAALSGAAVAVEWTRSCASCHSGGSAPGIAGLVLYIGLLAAAVRRGPSRFLFGGILFAFGVHAALAAQMILAGLVCGLCLAAAAGSLTLVALSMAVDPARLGRLAFIAPWSALIVAAAFGSSRPPVIVGRAPAESVVVVVFMQPDCPYCDELRTRVMPEIEKEFGARVRIDYRPASDLPAVRQTPTLILTPSRAGAQGRVIEGLPTLERLRGAIRDLETRS
jgi:thiol-disulfide isomerase/thioredoxin